VLLTELASHGLVVIADVDSCREDGTKAAAAVEWLLTQNEASGSEYFGKLMTSRVLVIGHSSGANGAIAASLKNPKITSLLLFAPALSSAQPAAIAVPTFYLSGSLDTTVPPELVKAAYRDTKANAWYAEREQQRHIGFAANPAVALFTRAWVYTQLFGDAGTARKCFYGPDWTLGKATGWKETLRNHSAP
jgi:predicted esterase